MAIDAIEFRNNIGDEDTKAVWIYQMWKQYDELRNPIKNLWGEIDQYLMATDTDATTNSVNEFNHRTHRPKLTQIYDNLIANYKPSLIPNRNWVTWVGEDDSAVAKQTRNLLEGYIRTKHRLSKFSAEVDKLLDDWVRTGNCFAGVTYVNQRHTDAQGKEIQGYKGPKLYRISPHDIVFNPFSTSFENAAKIVRSIHSMGDLQRKANEMSGQEGEVFRETLDRMNRERGWLISKGGHQLELKGSGTEEIKKHIQAMYDGFGNYMSYMMSGSVELHEFYGDVWDTETGEFKPNRKITIADRRYVILDEPIETWNGKPNIFHCAWRPRPENIWGQGPLDQLIGLQYRIDHLENMRADAFDKVQDPDRLFIGTVETAYSETGSYEYTIADGQGDVRDIPPDTTILNADLQIREIEDSMDLYAGSPKEAMGFRTAGEKTKFEVSQLMNAAGRIFQHKIERFETQILEPVLNAEVDAARRASDYKDTIELINAENGSVQFQSISSKDLYQNGKFVPIGARHYSRQQQLAQDARDMMQVVIQDPEMLQHFPSKNMAKLFEELMGFDEHALFAPFGRMYEQMELAKLQSAAQQQLQQFDMTSIEEPDEGEIEDEGI